MGVKLPVQVLISAVDRISAPMRQAQAQLRHTFAPLRQLNNGITSLAEAAGLPKLAKRVGDVRREFVGVARELAFIGGAGLAGVLGLVETFGRAGARIQRAASVLGIGVESLQELRHAALMYDVEEGELETGLMRLSKGLGQAARGQGTLAGAMQRLGIPVRDANGQLRRLDEVLPEIADRLNELDDDGKRTALTMAIFGRGGAALTPLLRSGSAGIARLRQEAHRLGVVMGPEQVAAAREFDDSWKRVTGALVGLRNLAGAAVAPALTDLANRLAGFLVAHRADLERFVRAFATELPGALERTRAFLETLYDRLRPVIAAGEWMVRTFGGANVVLAAMALIVGGKLIVALGQLSIALVNTTLVLSGSTIPTLWAATTAFVGGLVPAVTAFAVALVTEVIPAVIAAGVAILSTPIGWVLAGVAAIVAAGIFLWKNWDKVGAFFVRLWTTVKAAFLTAFKWVWDNMPWLLGPVGMLIKYWDRIRAFFVDLWGTVRDVFGRIVGFVREKVAAIGALLPDWLRQRLGFEATVAGGAAAPTVAGAGPAPEARVRVQFDNLPRGARVAPQGNSGVDLDLQMGYSMVGPGG